VFVVETRPASPQATERLLEMPESCQAYRV
jgi:hypothetical protein